MADVIPDYHVEQQKIRMNIANLRLQIEKCKLEIMEMVSRKKTAQETIEASEKIIVEKEKTLAELIETHGE